MSQIATKLSGMCNGSSLTFCALRHITSLSQSVLYVNDVKHPSLKSFCIQKQLTINRNSFLDIHNVRCISQSCNYYYPLSKGVKVNSGFSSNKDKFKKKSSKSSVKEFTIKEKTGDHDMSIKLNKMQNLLEKGKVIEIFIKHSTINSEKENAAYVSGIQMKLQDNLQGVAKLKMDYTNQHTTKLVIIPAIKPEEIKPAQNQSESS